ncbi:MAG: cell wall-active antibiotics response protein [Ignavibacteriaceae bacterium]|nr:cell wall-active antibiotics response protein [Ignavibacteriaceae bacterium]
MAENNKSTGRMFLGGVLMIAGVLFLLINLNFIHFNVVETLFSFPSIMIYIGLIMCLVKPPKRWVGIALIAVGSSIHISHYYNVDFGEFILPIILIGLGFMILIKHNRNTPASVKHEMSSTEEVWDDKLEVYSIFGGNSKFFNSDAFRGGNITSIFGGSEINLSGCKLAEGENIIDVIAIFGGTTIIVPKEWNVIIDVFPLFGGFGTKGKRDPMLVVEKDKALRIKGVVIFGGGEIKLV